MLLWLCYTDVETGDHEPETATTETSFSGTCFNMGPTGGLFACPGPEWPGKSGRFCKEMHRMLEVPAELARSLFMDKRHRFSSQAFAGLGVRVIALVCTCSWNLGATGLINATQHVETPMIAAAVVIVESYKKGVGSIVPGGAISRS